MNPAAPLTQHDFPSEEIEADLCVVGGGMSGLCCAIAAARRGLRVALLQDRHVLGGNASSEIRMWICGAHGPDNKEAGILEEIQLENCFRNPQLVYPVWDTVLYEKAAFQEGLRLVLSCAVVRVEMEAPDRIGAVVGWHLARQRWIRVRAKLFADCSGDSVLRTCGAPFRWGRESRDEFGERAALPVADRKTMGNSLLLQLREIDPAQHEPFTPPAWAHRFDDSHPRANHFTPTGHNFWWIEIGGEGDTIADADAIRDELYRIAFGVWAYIKNHPDGRGRRWELEWLGSLPGKRENVRYVGDHTLTQQDIESCGRFADIVGHGGWTMDDHPPAAFGFPGPPTRHWPAPSPFGIPYRCLYGTAVGNLLFAGRNISCTHLAMSATRVMATCAVAGQAAGTAAAIALRHGATMRGVHDRHLAELQNTLLDDDQWLPGRRRVASPLARSARLSASAGDPAPLLDGIERRQAGDWHALELAPGGHVELRFDGPRELGRLRLVGDSQLHRDKRQPCNWPLARHRQDMPAPLVRAFRVLVEDGASWREVARVDDNRRRLVQLPLPERASAVRVAVDATWGAERARLFACEVGAPDLTAAPLEAPWTSTPVARGSGA